MNSFSTNNEQRDGHIKSADFLDADNFPTMKFESNSISKKDDQLFVVHGDLTIKGISKSVDLLVEKSDTAKDPWGQTKIAFDVTAKINRTDFGLVWNAPLESGGVLLGEEVKIQAEVQFVLAQ
jgi:polyisoprenoid-binding protein YceI